MEPALKNVTIMGLGRFGGGLGAARWLASRGAHVLVTDLADGDTLRGAIDGLDAKVPPGAVEYRLGHHDEADFVACDLVVASPAVPEPWNNRYLEAARRGGVPITTEIRLLLEHLDRSRVIGVTGSAGKSTTTAMIHHVLVRAGLRAHLGGNIGGSLLPALDAIAADDWIVLELSSAMLYWLAAGRGIASAAGISPHIAVLTNIEPNHLDWHGTVEHYVACKESIFAHQVPGDHQVRGADFDPPDTPLPLRLPGRHNQRNAIVALHAVMRATGLRPKETAPLLADFGGLPHRLETVAHRADLRFVNDSKATTPRATMLAVEAFEQPSTIHLIVGGYDKKIDLSSIAALAPRVAHLYAIGSTGPALAARAGARAEVCGTLDVAVANAVRRMQPGETLLLSPGCASWDQFDDYQHRGQRFRALVEEALAADGSAI